MSTNVSIVEDDPALRSGFAKLISRSVGFCCIAEYGTAEEAIAEIPKKPPDIVLLDINLPLRSGIECVRELKPLLPTVAFIMLTMFGDRDRIFDALRAGAIGYLLKSHSSIALLAALRQVREGGAPMSPEIARQVTQFFHESQQSVPKIRSSDASLAILSEREREILELLAVGQHYKEIATILYISIDTVRSHVRNIYEKLQVHSRSEATAKFYGR